MSDADLWNSAALMAAAILAHVVSNGHLACLACSGTGWFYVNRAASFTDGVRVIRGRTLTSAVCSTCAGSGRWPA